MDFPVESTAFDLRDQVVHGFTTAFLSYRRIIMPRGDKSKYTDKQKRKAEHIAESYEDRGVPEKVAKSRAWATVNKESGGGNKSGSGHGKPDTHVSSKKGGKIGGAAAAS